MCGGLRKAYPGGGGGGGGGHPQDFDINSATNQHIF